MSVYVCVHACACLGRGQRSTLYLPQPLSLYFFFLRQYLSLYLEPFQQNQVASESLGSTASSSMALG